MFKAEYRSLYVKFGSLAALVFCLPLVYFIHAADYAKTWVLFAGNVLFLVVLCTFLLNFNKLRNENSSTQTMLAAGHITTVCGIVLSCIVAAIALAFFGPALPDKVLEDAPAQTGSGETHGLVFFVFMNAIIGNLAAGSFASIVVPYTAKFNQTKDKKSEVLNN